MVNYKRLFCEAVVLTAAVSVIIAAPAHDCEKGDKLFDQRQNGSENYRVNIDGVVIAVAPAESLLSAFSEFDLNDLLGDLEDYDFQKPIKPSLPSDDNEKPHSPLEPKPQDSKPQDLKPDESPAKPEDPKPLVENKTTESPLSDVSLNNEVKGHKKEILLRNKQEKTQRLKNHLAHLLLPLIRKTRHH